MTAAAENVVHMNEQKKDDNSVSLDENLGAWCEEQFTTLDKLVSKRSEINKKISGIWSAIEGKGFSKPATQAAYKFRNTDDVKREKWDLTYQFLRQASGNPVQPDLLLEGKLTLEAEKHQKGKSE